MQNYYDILGLPSYEDSQDAILMSYKNGTQKLRETIFDKKDIESKLILFNEAFLVLSDADLKREYDYCLSSNTESSTLSSSILAKRERAKTFIQSKLANTPQKKKRSKWPAILCGFFLLSALGTILKTCTQASLESSSATYQELGTFKPSDDHWSKYEIANSFSISIPNTMELRNDYDQYTQFLKENGFSISNAEAVFQQSDLSNLSDEAYDTYCRILIGHYQFSLGELERHNETSYIDAESHKNFREVVDEEAEPWTYIGSM